MKKTNKTLEHIKKRLGPKKYELLKKITLFAMGGLIILLTKLILSYFLVDEMNIELELAYLIILAISVIIGYFFSYYVTFHNTTYFYRKMIKYLISVGIFYAADYFLVIILANLLNLYHAIAIIIVSALIFTLKFIAYNNIIFKEKLNIRS